MTDLSAAEAERDEQKRQANVVTGQLEQAMDERNYRIAEREALQSRLDAVKALAEEWDAEYGHLEPQKSMTGDLRAALEDS